MSKKVQALIVIAIVSALVAFSGYFDAMLLIKNQRISLNEATVNELGKSSLIDGEIDFVYGPFAELEETRKKMEFLSERLKQISI